MKRNIYLLSLMILGLLFITCGENEELQTLSLGTKSVELLVGNTVDVNVKGGVSPYSVTCANEGIAKASIKGKVITINGLKAGKTTLDVTCKDGAKATLAITVVADPYEDEKKNVAVRFKWDTFNKTDGIVKGTFMFTKTENKTVTFSYTNTERNESLIVSLIDKDGIIGNKKITSHNALTGKSLGRLKVVEGGEGKMYDVTSWRLIQAKPADEKNGTPRTYWITFIANGKSGIFVAPLTEE